jgi:wobble nucleotide-excising tRNase
MKINRISRIKTHRVYRNFSWPTNLDDFSQFNVIYGWNGVGKTTLSNLFRYLEVGEVLSEGEAQFLIDGDTVDLSIARNASFRNVRVFNRDTVDRAIFEVPNKQLSPIYFLGEDSVEKQKSIEILKVKLLEAQKQFTSFGKDKSLAEREIETLCTNEAKAIKNLLTVSGGGAYNNYDARNYKQSMETIAGSDVNVSLEPQIIDRLTLQKDARPKEAIANLSGDIPDVKALTTDIQELLAQSIVSGSIPSLVANPALAGWVQSGLHLHANGDEKNEMACKFCDQPLPLSRIAAIEAHFNDEFRAFAKRIDFQIDRIEKALAAIDRIVLTGETYFYEHLVEHYRKETAKFTQMKWGTKSFLEALLKALHEKKQKPFERVELSKQIVSFGDANSGLFLKILEALAASFVTLSSILGHGALNAINELINQHNEYSTKFIEKRDEARRALELAHVAVSADNFKALKIKRRDAAENQKLSENALRDLQSKINDV